MRNLMRAIQRLISITDFQEILKGGFWSLLLKIIGVLAGFIFTWLIVRLYGASSNGVFALVSSIYLIGSMLVVLGLDKGIIALVHGEDSIFFKTRLNQYSVIIFFFSLLVVLILILLASSINDLTIKSNSNYDIYLGAITIPFWSLTIYNAAILRSYKRILAHSYILNLSRFIVGIVVLLVLHRLVVAELNVPIIANFFAVFVTFIFSSYLVRKEVFRKKLVINDLFENQGKLIKGLKVSIPMMFASSMLLIMSWTDSIVLSIFDTTENLGKYNVAIKVASFTSFSLIAINSIYAPKIAKMYAERDIFRMRKLTFFSANLNFIVSSVVFVSILTGSDYILAFFGEEFIEVRTILLILALSQFLNSIAGPTGNILQMTGNQIVFLKILMVAVLINVILSILLVSKYGIDGVAYATFFSSLFWNMTSILWILRKLRISPLPLFKYKLHEDR